MTTPRRRLANSGSEAMNGPEAGQMERNVAAIRAFAAAVDREAPTLSELPELLFQQLHNRLKWEPQPVPGLLATAVRNRADRPWIDSKFPFRESGGLVRTLRGHDGAVNGCALSTDGRLIVSAGADQTLRLWELATGAQLAAWSGHTDQVRSCAFTPDAERVVSGSHDRTVSVWEVASGRELRVLEGHTGAVNAVAVSPDGRFAISASSDHTLKVWNLETYTEEATLEEHRGPVVGCSFGPDGRWLVSTGGEMTSFEHAEEMMSRYQEVGLAQLASPSTSAILWEVRAPGGLLRRSGPSVKERGTLTAHMGGIYASAIAPDGSFFVTAGGEGELIVWDAATRKARATLTGHSHSVHDCAISPDGAFIVSASADRTIRIWTSDGVPQATLYGHGGGVSSCAITPDGALIVSTSLDGSLKVWDAAVSSVPTALPGHGGVVFSIEIGSDGRSIVSAGGDGSVLLSYIDGREGKVLSGHEGAAFDCTVSRDGSFVVSSGEDGTVRIWDASTGTERTSLESHEQAVVGCSLAPDASFILSAEATGVLHVWRLDGRPGVILDPRPPNEVVSETEARGLVGTTARLLQLKATVNPFVAVRRTLAQMPRSGSAGTADAGVTEDGAWIFSTYEGTVHLWDSKTGEHRERFPHGRRVTSCAVDPGANFLVAAGPEDESITIVNLGALRPGPKPRHGALVEHCAISPDASFAVSAGADGTVKIWSLPGGGLEGTIPAHRGRARRCAVTPDARYVLSVGTDARLAISEVAGGTRVATMPLLGVADCVRPHPWLPLIACGDSGGGLYLLEPIHVEFGPIALWSDESGRFSCPACGTAQTGSSPLACRNSACAMMLRPLARRPHRTGAKGG